jgi:hypothetical protein
MDLIWASVIVNFLIVFIVPRLIKKPTGVQVIDDIVLYLNTQKSFLIASSIVVGLTTYLAQKWIDSGAENPPSSPEKY